LNLVNPFRAELSGIPYLNDVFDFIIARVNAVWNVQHNGTDGTHKAITATALTVTPDTTDPAGTGLVRASGTGQHTFGGDVVARNGSGVESGIGKLATVNGTALLASEVVRDGLLLGGVANGMFLERRVAGSPFTSGYELRIWDLPWDGITSVLRFGEISGRPTLMDGGTGSTAVDLGASTRYLNKVSAAQFWRPEHAAAQGEWIAFTPTRTASSGTWTGGGTGDCAYMVIGKTMFLNIEVGASSNSLATAILFIDIPGGFTSARAAFFNGFVNDGAGVTPTQALLSVGAAGTKVQITKFDGTNFAANAGTLYTRTVFFFETQ
jgi:hypothetical protein